MRFLVAYSAPPDPVADGLRGPTFKGKGEGGEGMHHFCRGDKRP